MNSTLVKTNLQNIQTNSVTGGLSTPTKLRLTVILAVLASVSLAQAGLFVKTNNADALNLATSWTNNAVPGAADIAQWDATVSDVNNTTNTLGANLSWGGIKLVNPVANIQINAGSTLTVGTSGIDLSSATADLILSNGVAMPDYTVQTWSVPVGRTLSLAGAFTRSGGAALKFNEDGIINMAGGTASSMIGYALYNGTDVAAWDASKNVSSVASVIGYASVSAWTQALLQQYVDMDATSAATGTTDDINCGTKIWYPRVVHFNTPQPSGRGYWSVNAYNGQVALNTGVNTILVTTNVGACNVIFSGNAHAFRWGQSSGSELMVDQENTAGDFSCNGYTSQKNALAGNIMTKRGAGRAIFNAALWYSGPTRILEGELMLNGTVASSGVTISSGAILSGSGTIAGSVNSLNGGAVWPGNRGAGTLTLSNAVTLNAGSSLNFYNTAVPVTNTTAPLNLGGNLTVGGAVTVSILAGYAAAGQYPLIHWTNAVTAPAFANFSLGQMPLRTQGYLSNNVANNTIDLVVTNINEPLKWAVGNGNWDVFGTANWLDASGNSTTYQQTAALGDAVLFDDTAAGISPITVTLDTNPIPSGVTVNASKNYVFTGSGSIAGAGGLTKAGSGTLTLGTANAFTGSLNLNGGTVNFSALNNLGAGAINFGGGTLKYNGNSDDISVRTVTLGAGGGTIDDGGNTVTFANPIGNSGVGGLIKTGAGTLTLGGTNRYSGGTVVANGTLALGYNTYISNSTAILVNSGAVLDVATSGVGLTLRGSPVQILAGAGTINGTVISSNGIITPGTNGVIGTLTFGSDLTLAGGTVNLDLATDTAQRDLIVVGGNLFLSGGTVQLNVTGLLTNGVYKLIQYAGGLIGSPANLVLSGYSQTGKILGLSSSINGEIDLVVSTQGGAGIVWQGDGGNNFWDVETSLNFTNLLGTPVVFVQGDKPTFDDSTPNTTVNLMAALQPGLVTVTADANNFVFNDGTGSGGGKLGGAGGLTKNGASTLTILTANLNSGPTVINAGTIQVGNNSTTGDLGAGNVTNNGSLLFQQTDNRSVAGQISGTGSLTQQGNAGTTLSLAADNIYSGSTTIASGTLQIGAGGATGSLGTSSVTDNSALVFNRTGSLTVSNAINGSGSLSVNGGGIITLAAANAYAGGTAINAGKLVLGSDNAIVTEGNFTVQAAGTNDLNGHDLTVTRLNSAIGTGGRIVNNAGTATNVVTIDYNGTGTADNSIAILDNEGAGGKIAVVKINTGSQIMRGASTYSGGTIVSNGTLNVRGNTALGTGLVTLRGGNLSFSGITLANAIQADTNATLDTPGNANVTLTGNITTASNLTVFIDNNETWTWNGAATQLAGVTGTIFITPGNGFFRFNGSRGSANATFDMTGSTATINSVGAGVYDLGALVGDASPFIGGAAGSTFVIGAKNLSTTFGGTLNSANNNLIKVGTGSLTLSGTDNFTGSTVVSNGVLALVDPVSFDTSPAIALGSSTAIIDVSARSDASLNLGNSVVQTLSGFGTITGSLNENANSTVNVGLGTLHVTGTATLNGALVMQLNRTNAITAAKFTAGTLANASALTVTNVGPAFQGGETFQLFSAGVTGFTATNLPALTGSMYWVNNLAVDGSIAVVNPVATNPTNLTAIVSGNTLTLSWPADHTGWHLQIQTNALSTGIDTNWVTLPGSDLVNTTNLTISPANGSVFYRMVYP